MLWICIERSILGVNAWSKVFRLPRWSVHVAYVLGQREADMINFLSELLNTREVMLIAVEFPPQKSYNNKFSIRFQAKDHGVSHFHLLSTYCMHLQQNIYTSNVPSDPRQVNFYLHLTSGWSKAQGIESFGRENKVGKCRGGSETQVLFNFSVWGWTSAHAVSCNEDQ